MSAGVPPGEPLAAMTPAGRVARWALSVQFAIKAASEDEARVVLREVLAGLVRELSLCGEPVFARRRFQRGIWVAAADVDVRPVAPGESPWSHCAYVASHFGVDVGWTSCRSAVRRGER